MVRRAFGVVVLLAAVAVAQVAAQDAVAIKFADPKAGERVQVTEDETAVVTTTVKGMSQDKVDKSMKSVVYVEECVTPPEAAGKKSLKATRTYSKIEGSKDGQPLDAGLVGKTIRIEKAGGKYTFTVDGKPVAGAIAAELEQAYNKPDGTSAKDFFPETPLKAGDTWKVDSKKLLAGLADDKFTFDAAKAAMTGKLVKTYQKDGAGYGVFEVKASLPITGLGPKNPLTVKPGSQMTLTLTGDGCIDGTVPGGETATKMQLRIEAATMGVDVTVVADVDQKKKATPLPKK